MKKNNMKYQISEIVYGKTISGGWIFKHFTTIIYVKPVNLFWAKSQAKTIDVELKLEEAKGPEQWVKVRLLLTAYQFFTDAQYVISVEPS
ncbi:hypothetical protein [Methylobacter sp. BBA5.1]|uniref:hypothetical protein n=1 Tax=Methylobacter sp. BBA5.1 TaxID=1495064 RepID=UPI000566BDAC|nr:hypothetical protein [Methylobacter sp. BBA5.1]